MIGEDFVIHPSTALATAKPSSNQKEVYIKDNPSVFLCLNIPSYMAGTNPWGSTKG